MPFSLESNKRKYYQQNRKYRNNSTYNQPVFLKKISDLNMENNIEQE
jgi:hypothetical protein